jgi:hypothetical protein
MLKSKDMISSIENFLDALINTRHLDELELWEYVRAFSEMKVNRLRALDPDRNR